MADLCTTACTLDVVGDVILNGPNAEELAALNCVRTVSGELDLDSSREPALTGLGDAGDA